LRLPVAMAAWPCRDTPTEFCEVCEAGVGAAQAAVVRAPLSADLLSETVDTSRAR